VEPAKEQYSGAFACLGLRAQGVDCSLLLSLIPVL
jgi:hypothetical protein